MKKDGFTALKMSFSQSTGIIQLSDEQLKKVHTTLLEMLDDFMRVAEKNNLSYTLCGGSVLGAIRHHGFIPWDDDLDLNMSRQEYDKLTKIFDKEMGDKYVLCAPLITKHHGFTGCTIRKKGTVFRSFNEIPKPEEECGIGVDIFVVENTYDNSILRKIHGYICLAAGYLLTCRKSAEDLSYFEPYFAGNNELRDLIMKKAKIGRFFRFISVDSATRIAMYWYTRYKNNASKYVTIPSGRKHYFGEMAKREDFLGSIPASFEGRIVPVPKDYPGYMERLYGKTYMQLPPEEDREIHSVVEFKL